MSRLLTCGFEGRSPTLDGLLNSSASSYSSVGGGRVGGTALTIDALSSFTAPYFNITPANTIDPGLYVRLYVKIDASITSDVWIVQPRTGSIFFPLMRWNGLTQRVEVWSQTTDPFNTYAFVTETSAKITPDVWTYIGYGSYIASGGTESFWHLIVNDNESSGSILNYRIPVGSEIVPSSLYLPHPTAKNRAAGYLWVDDVAINDNSFVISGSNQDIPSPASITHILPNSDISISGFVAGAGGTTNLYQAIDNTPPAGLANASATNSSQIKSTGSNNRTSTFGFPTFAAAGLPVGAIIFANTIAIGGGFGGNATTGLLASINGGSITIGEADANWYQGMNVDTYASGWAKFENQIDLGGFASPPLSSATGANTISIRKNNTSSNDTHCCYLALQVEVSETLGGSQGVQPPTTTVTTSVSSIDATRTANKHKSKADLKMTSAGVVDAAVYTESRNRHHNHRVNQFLTSVNRIVPVTAVAPVVKADTRLTGRFVQTSRLTPRATYAGTTPTVAVLRVVPHVVFPAAFSAPVFARAPFAVVPVVPHQNGPGPDLHPPLAIITVVGLTPVASRSTGDSLLARPRASVTMTLTASAKRNRGVVISGG